MPVHLLGLPMKEAAARCNVQVWQVRQVFLKGLMAEPGRCGMGRVIPVSDLPELEAALKKLGYVKSDAAPAAKPAAKKRSKGGGNAV
jgi:hypothetical protein